MRKASWADWTVYSCIVVLLVQYNRWCLFSAVWRRVSLVTVTRSTTDWLTWYVSSLVTVTRSTTDWLTWYVSSLVTVTRSTTDWLARYVSSLVASTTDWLARYVSSLVAVTRSTTDWLVRYVSSLVTVIRLMLEVKTWLSLDWALTSLVQCSSVFVCFSGTCESSSQLHK